MGHLPRGPHFLGPPPRFWGPLQNSEDQKKRSPPRIGPNWVKYLRNFQNFFKKSFCVSTKLSINWFLPRAPPNVRPPLGRRMADWLEEREVISLSSDRNRSIKQKELFLAPRKRLIPIQPHTPQTYSVGRSTIAAMDISRLKVNEQVAGEACSSLGGWSSISICFDSIFLEFQNFPWSEVIRFVAEDREKLEHAVVCHVIRLLKSHVIPLKHVLRSE